MGTTISHMRMELKCLRKILIAIVGGTVILIGVAMIVLPGPAILVIPLGLTILATEFLWARRWLNRIRAHLPQRTGKRRQGDEQKSPNREV